jgi:hypothetical protein
MGRFRRLVFGYQGVPWHVALRGCFFYWFWRPAWRGYWVRYWESQGISEEEQMQWAAEEAAKETV